MTTVYLQIAELVLAVLAAALVGSQAGTWIGRLIRYRLDYEKRVGAISFTRKGYRAVRSAWSKGYFWKWIMIGSALLSFGVVSITLFLILAVAFNIVDRAFEKLSKITA